MSLFGTGRKEAALAILMLVVLAVVIHAPGLFFGAHRGLIDASTPLQELSQNHQQQHRVQQLEGATNQTILWPAMLQAAESVEAGQAPQWNPNARFGEPLTFSGAHIWYPPYWLLMFGSEPWRLDLLLCLHTILAAVTMFRCLQAMTLSRYVAFIGGATYGLGWFMTGSLDRLPEAAAAAILPLAVEQCWRSLFGRPHYATAPILGLSLGLMFVTGGTSTAWFGTALCAGYFIFNFSGVARDEWPRLLRNTGTSILVAGLMTAPLWLDWIQYSSSRLAAADARVQHLQPAGLLGLVAPGLFASLDGSTPEILRAANPGADPLELLLYPGAMVLFLALLGLLRPKRNFHSIFWIAVAGIGLILTLDSPLSSAFAEATAWNPDRPGASLVLLHFAFVVLAAMGLENFLDAPMTRRAATPIVCTVSIVLGFALLASALFYPTPIAAVVSALTGQDATSLVEGNFRLVRLPLAQPAIAVIAISILFLSWRRLGVMRFKPALSTVIILDLVMVALTSVPRVESTLGAEIALRIPATNGRVLSVSHADLPPRSWLAASGKRTMDADGSHMLARSAAYLKAIDPSMVNAGHRTRVVPLLIPQFLDNPLLTIAGIDAAVSSSPFHSENFRPLQAAPLGGTTSSGLFIATRETDPASAKIYYKTLDVASPALAKLALEQHSAELETLLVLEPRPQPATEPSPASLRPVTEAVITWRERSPSYLRLDVNMHEGRGHLFLSEAYAAGWHATVDDEPVAIQPAQLAFRAVALGAGEHRVEFQYRPWSLYPGLALFLGGIVTAISLLLFGATMNWRSRRAAQR